MENKPNTDLKVWVQTASILIGLCLFQIVTAYSLLALNIWNTALDGEHTITRGKSTHILGKCWECLRFAENTLSLTVLALPTCSLRMAQDRRPRRRAASGPPASPWQISPTARNISQRTRPVGQTKTHTVIGTHFLSVSTSHLSLTLFHGFCCRVYYFAVLLGVLFVRKIASFNSMYCSWRQVFFPVLDAGQ